MGHSGPQLAGSRLNGRSLTPGFSKVDRVEFYKVQLYNCRGRPSDLIGLLIKPFGIRKELAGLYVLGTTPRALVASHHVY